MISNPGASHCSAMRTWPLAMTAPAVFSLFSPLYLERYHLFTLAKYDVLTLLFNPISRNQRDAAMDQTIVHF